MTAPYYKPLIGFPKTFSRGTDGLIHAEVVLLEAKDSAELCRLPWPVKKQNLMLKRMDSLELGFQPDATRYSDSDLHQIGGI